MQAGPNRRDSSKNAEEAADPSASVKVADQSLRTGAEVAQPASTVVDRQTSAGGPVKLTSTTGAPVSHTDGVVVASRARN